MNRFGWRPGRPRPSAWIARLRSRPRLLAMWAGAAVLLAALLGWVVFASPLLAARQVEVSGVSGATREAVRRVAAQDLDQPLAKVDTQRIATEVSRVGIFASVRVARSWPGTIVIEVQQRQPVLALRDPQGQLKVADAEGAVFATVTRVPAGVAVLTTSGADASAVRAAAQAVQSVSAAHRREIRTVEAASANRVVLRLGSTEVVWGDAGRGSMKAAVLDRLMTQGTFRRIDVSAPDYPATVD